MGGGYGFLSIILGVYLSQPVGKKCRLIGLLPDSRNCFTIAFTRGVTSMSLVVITVLAPGQ